MKIQHYGAYYAGTPYYPCDQFIVDQWQAGCIPDPSVMDRIKALNPAFLCEAYKSAQDSYTKNDDGSEHPQETLLKSICTRLNIDIEACYLHWAEDTQIDWDYTGSNPDIILYPANSRVVVYRGAHQSGNKVRNAHCYLPVARPAMTEYMLTFPQQTTSLGNHWDGLMLDNCGKSFYNWGVKLVSGGTVREANALITSLQGSPFILWHWSNLRDWMVQFRTAMHAIGKTVSNNAANAWTNEYATTGCTDRVNMEFVGSLTRDVGLFTIASHKANHALCAANGVHISACPPVGYGGTPAESDLEIIYNNLCLHLLVMDQGMQYSTTHNQDLTWPYRPDWPQRIISPAEALVEATAGARLGTPTGEAFIFMEGTSPAGKPYQIWERDFTRGAVYGRMLGAWNELTTDIVSFARPGIMRLLSVDGTTLTTPATIDIKNGGGAIIMR